MDSSFSAASPRDKLQQIEPPPEVLALGEPEQVELLSRFYGSSDSGMGRASTDGQWAGGMSATFVGIVFVCLGVFLKTRMATAPLAVVGGLIGVGIILLGVGIYLLSKPRTTTDAKYIEFAFAFFPASLAYRHKNSWSLFRWNEIVEFRGPYAAHPEAQVKLQSGASLELRESDRDIFQEQPVLREVERRATRVLTTEARRRLGAGETLVFGPVSVHREGVSFQGQSAAWNEIERIEIIAATPGVGGGVAGALLRQHVDLKIVSIAHQWNCGQFLPIPNRGVLLQLLRENASCATWNIEPTAGLFMPLDAVA
jgi:hypothetical protein